MFCKTKKLLAGILAAAMTVACVLPASAATGSPTTSTEPKAQTAVVPAGSVDVEVATTTSGTAAIKSVAETSKVNIPVKASVKVDGVSYSVTSIAAKAFAKCTSAKKVIIANPAAGAKIVIKKNAFSGAKKLKAIVVKAKKAKQIVWKTGAFNGLNTKKMVVKTKGMSKAQVKKLKKQLVKAGFKGKVR